MYSMLEGRGDVEEIEVYFARGYPCFAHVLEVTFGSTVCWLCRAHTQGCGTKELVCVCMYVCVCVCVLVRVFFC